MRVDVAIIGGGIAGLWTLARLKQLGFNAVLIEKHALGTGQTIASQGIIHGGAKYALTGKMSQATTSIADMPSVWQACLQGKGEVDLSGVTVNSDYHYLFSTNRLASKISHFLAGQALRNSEAITKDAYPEIFKNPNFKGQVYRLNERVLDVYSLLQEFRKQYSDSLIHATLLEDELKRDETGNLKNINLKLPNGDVVSLVADCFVFTAGGGNLPILQQLNIPIKTQKRPLHMVFMKFPQSYPLFAHAVGNTPKPRITITTHQANDGHTVWYMGGELAEAKGVVRNEEEQLVFAKKEINELFPWLTFDNAQWATYRIDRVEALQADGKRPDTATVFEQDNCFFAWPTKLALAPQLANRIVNLVLTKYQKKALTLFSKPLPKPGVAEAVWGRVEWSRD